MPVTSVEEIRLLAALGRTEGVVGAQTEGIIAGASALRKLSASDVMLPRKQVVYLSADQHPATGIEHVETFSVQPFSILDD